MSDKDKQIWDWFATLGKVIEGKQAEASLMVSDVFVSDPDFLNACLDNAESKAVELSDELPQRDTILGQIERARQAAAREDNKQLNTMIYFIDENFRRAGHDQWAHGVQAQYADNARRRNEELRPINEARWQEWRDAAEIIRQEKPDIADNDSAVARIVKTRLRSEYSVSAIRKRI